MDTEKLKHLLPQSGRIAKHFKKYKERKLEGGTISLIPYELSTIDGAIVLAKSFREAARMSRGSGLILMQVSFGQINPRVARQILLDIASMDVPVAMEHPPDYLEDLVVHIVA